MWCDLQVPVTMRVMQLLHIMQMTYTMKMICIMKTTHTVQTACPMKAIHMIKMTCTVKAHHLIQTSCMRNSQIGTRHQEMPVCSTSQWKTLWTVMSCHGLQRLYCGTCYRWVCQLSSWLDAVRRQCLHSFFVSSNQGELPAESATTFTFNIAGCLITVYHVLLVAYDVVAPHHRSVASCSM